MKRFLLVLAAVAGGCNKPTPEDCRQAITHMEALLGTEAAGRNADIEGEVRRCRGGSKKEAVACAISARTLDELNACAFMGTRGKKPGQDTAAPSPKPPAAPAPGASAPAAPPAPAPGTPSSGSN